jgi:rare lipoprotein A (peptidoglycan hydrolase)
VTTALRLLLAASLALCQPAAPRPAQTPTLVDEASPDRHSSLGGQESGRTGAPSARGGSSTGPAVLPVGPASATTGTRAASRRPQTTAKPSPAPSTPPQDGLSGVASWYAAPVGTAAAGPALRAALGRSWRGRTVTVTRGGASVRVLLDDWCQCYGTRLVDLSRDAFAALGDPSLGLLGVEVTWP